MFPKIRLKKLIILWQTKSLFKGNLAISKKFYCLKIINGMKCYESCMSGKHENTLLSVNIRKKFIFLHEKITYIIHIKRSIYTTTFEMLFNFAFYGEEGGG